MTKIDLTQSAVLPGPLQPAKGNDVMYRLILCALFLALIPHTAVAADDCRDLLANPLLVEKAGSQQTLPSATWNYARPIEAARTAKDPATQRLIESYFSLSLAADGTARLPRFLQPQSLIYILESLNLSDQARLSTLIDEAASWLRDKKTASIEDALKSAGDSEVVANIIRLDETVRSLKKAHKSAVNLAIENHDNRGQLYGDKPYSTHLRQVRAVLKRFGYGPRDSVSGLRLGTAAWLHDIVEDTPVSLETLEATFGKDIADIITNLTNEPDRPGLSSDERKRITFERIARRPESRIIKLADRIANVEESIITFFQGKPTKIEKYYKEWPAFKRYIQKSNEVPKMWEHLERLLTDRQYALQFVLHNVAPQHQENAKSRP